MVLSTSHLSGIRTATMTFAFPVLRYALSTLPSAILGRFALCSMRFAFLPCPIPIPLAGLINLGGFLFFGRLEIQDPRPDPASTPLR